MLANTKPIALGHLTSSSGLHKDLNLYADRPTQTHTKINSPFKNNNNKHTDCSHELIGHQSPNTDYLEQQVLHTTHFQKEVKKKKKQH